MGEPLVVIGNGMAATRFVDELMQRALGRYSVIVVGAEPRLSYNRVLLSSLLAGEVGEAAIEIEAARMVERARRRRPSMGRPSLRSIVYPKSVTLANGLCFGFSKLVLRPVRNRSGFRSPAWIFKTCSPFVISRTSPRCAA